MKFLGWKEDATKRTKTGWKRKLYSLELEERSFFRLCTRYAQFFNILCLLFSSVSSQLYPQLAKQEKSHLQNSLNMSLHLILKLTLINCFIRVSWLKMWISVMDCGVTNGRSPPPQAVNSKENRNQTTIWRFYFWVVMKYYRYVDVYVYNVYIIYKSSFYAFHTLSSSRTIHLNLRILLGPWVFSALELVHHFPAFQKIFGFEWDFGASGVFHPGVELWTLAHLSPGEKSAEIGFFSKLFSRKGGCILDSWVL